VKPMLYVVLVLTSSLLGIATAGAADFADGEKLYDSCAAPLTKPESAVCIGYIAGVVDALLYAQERKLSPMLICLPKRIGAGTIKDVIQRHLEDHPEERKYSAASTIHAKLHELWPCPN
jgi:hypothetical protein